MRYWVTVLPLSACWLDGVDRLPRLLVLLLALLLDQLAPSSNLNRRAPTQGLVVGSVLPGMALGLSDYRTPLCHLLTFAHPDYSHFGLFISICLAWWSPWSLVSIALHGLLNRLIPQVLTVGETMLLSQITAAFVRHLWIGGERVSHPARLGGVLLAACLSTVLLMAISTSSPFSISGSSKGSRSSSLGMIALSFIGGLWLFGLLLGAEESVQRVLGLLRRPSVQALLLYWVILLGVTAGLSSLFLSWRPFGVSLQVMRKFYHGLAVALFLPGAWLSTELLAAALASAAVGFILLETARLTGPQNPWLDAAMGHFRSELDQGQAILSHLWLLLGCSLPVWLRLRPAQPDLASLSGILSLGIMDAVAATFGSAYGRHAWPGTRKTVEGSAAGVLALIASSKLLAPSTPWARLLVHGVLMGGWEAFCDQNDNLTLPLLGLILCK